MHELSIATHVVETVTESLAETQGRIANVRLKVGVFAGVVADALQFSWDVATEGTRLEGSTLLIEEVKGVVHCPQCDADRILVAVHQMRCPVCDAWTPDVVAGNELEIKSVELAPETESV